MLAKLRKQDLNQIIIKEILYYAKELSKRGYVSNTLGTVAVRAQHPTIPGENVVYTKRAEISLEEMTMNDIVVTSIPRFDEEALSGGALLYGRIPPSVGHQLNLEIFRYRPDVCGIIHVHQADVIAYFAADRKEIEHISADYPLIMGKRSHVLPPNVNVELDVSSVKNFIGNTNAIVLESHGVTALGSHVPTHPRGEHVSEAYHRLNTLVREVITLMKAKSFAAAHEAKINLIPEAEVQWMYDHADKIVYPFSRR